MNYNNPKDSANLGGYYGNNTNHPPQKHNQNRPNPKPHPNQIQQQNQQHKRQITYPKAPFPKKQKDKSHVIIAALIAAGILIPGSIAIDKIQNNQELNKIVETFSDAIKETYQNSEFMMQNFDMSTYAKYVKPIIKDTIKTETPLQDFLSQEEYDTQTWLYILSGEGDRLSIQNDSILSAFNHYYSYSEDVSFDKKTGEPDKLISYFSHLAQICTTENNKNDLIALFDAEVGSSSISNSKDSLNYTQSKIEEIYSYDYIPTLEYNISTNNNFEKNIEDSPSRYMQPYFNLYNQRIESAQNIISGHSLQDVREPETLKKLVEKTSKKDITDSYQAAKYGIFIEALPKSEYISYITIRNKVYQSAIDVLRDSPETKNALTQDINNIANRLHAYDAYDSKNPQILQEIYSSFTDLEKANKAVEKAKAEIKRTGFDDFSH